MSAQRNASLKKADAAVSRDLIGLTSASYCRSIIDQPAVHGTGARDGSRYGRFECSTAKERRSSFSMSEFLPAFGTDCRARPVGGPSVIASYSSNSNDGVGLERRFPELQTSFGNDLQEFKRDTQLAGVPSQYA